MEDITVHVCTDASESAYAAAVCVKKADVSGNIIVTLVIAKARPAHIKRQSILQPELQGAVLGARLSQYVSAVLGV